MPEITQADRDAAMPVETMTAMEMSTALLAGLMVLGDPVGECPRPVIGRYQMLKSSEIIDLVRRKHIIPCHRSYIARIIELLSAPPAPADSPLTAEAVKAMLPVRDGAYRTNTATCLGKFGSIEWIDLHSGFLLYINGRLTQFSELGTTAKLAALVAALGIEVQS